MRTALLLLIIIALPVAAAAHPGKTDRQGGHQCLKDCAEWDLYYREYHTHDKDGRPVRVVKQRPVRKQQEHAAPTASPEQEQRPSAVPFEASASPVVRAPVVPGEPESSVLPWLLLVLLLLLILAVRRRTGEADAKNK